MSETILTANNKFSLKPLNI